MLTRTTSPGSADRVLAIGLTLLMLLVLAWPGVAVAHGERPEIAASGDVSGAHAATLALLEAGAHWRAAPATDRGLLASAVADAARARRDAIAALLQTDPAAAQGAMLPASLRDALPAEALPYLERDVTLDGSLVTYHVDARDGISSRFLYFLDTIADGRLSLHFAHDPPQLASGTRVRVSAVQLGRDVLAESADAAVASIKAAALQNTLGAQRTLMIYVNFADNAVQPFSMSAAQSMFTRMSDYWYEASYQQTWLAGDVAGWFTVPVSSATCDYTTLATYAKQAAASAGYVLANYDHYVYVFPTWTACLWAGLGQIGGRPTEAWINPQAGLILNSFAHELGHNLGVYHAHGLSCPGGAPIAATGCTKTEYGDGFDMMAAPQGTPHYSAFMKELLGWLDSGVSPPIVTVPAQQGSASFTIAPYETARDATPRALKIPRVAACGSATDYFYVESRQAIGFDAYLAGLTAIPLGSPISPADNLLGGVLVHDAIPGGASVAGSLNSSLLLDMAASTTGWAGPALVAGASFTDPVSGVTLTPLAVGTSGASVSVTYPPAGCVRAAPTVTLAPTTTQYAAAGATVGYAATVKNNDSCGCASSSLTVAVAPPSGWAASAPASAVLAPGAASSVSLAVTSPTSATAAYYAIPITATNTAAMSSSASGTVAITTAPAAPTVVVSPAGIRSASPGVSLAYSVGVTNNGSASTSFIVAASVPTGWSAVGGQTASIAPGATASASLTVTSPSSAAAATYTIPIAATDAAAPAATASVSALVSIVASPSLAVMVSTDQSTYTRPAKRSASVYATIACNVAQGGVAAPGVPVSIQVRAPTGGTTTLSGTTGSGGTASASYAIKSKSATGSYAATCTATVSGTTASATTSFSVR